MKRFHLAALLFTLLSLCECQDLKPGVNEPGFTCTPGAVFKADCNTCSCDTSGTLARCTAMACPPEERTKRAIAEEPPCTPGAVKMVLCNRCRCTTTRKWACTRKGCPDGVEEVEDMNNYDKPQKLKRSIDDYFISPGFDVQKSILVDEFEEIEDVDDFEPKAKVSHEAEEPLPLGQPCEANSSFKYDCNTCWCRSDGKGPKYCTRIACKPKTYKPLVEQS